MIKGRVKKSDFYHLVGRGVSRGQLSLFFFFFFFLGGLFNPFLTRLFFSPPPPPNVIHAPQNKTFFNIFVSMNLKHSLVNFFWSFFLGFRWLCCDFKVQYTKKFDFWVIQGEKYTFFQSCSKNGLVSEKLVITF